MGAIRRREYWQAAGACIRQTADWELWAGYTFDRDVSDREGFRLFTQYAHRLVREHLKTHLWFAWAWNNNSDRPHYHALVGVMWGEPVNILVEDIRKHWTHGISYVTRYDPTKGGPEYMVRKHRHWDMNIACPRTGECKRRNCLYAPSPWPSFSSEGD